MQQQHSITSGLTVLTFALCGLTAAYGPSYPWKDDAQASCSVSTAFDPVPTSAVAPTLPASGYITQDLGKGAYAVLDGVYQSMFLVTTDGVIVIDAPATTGDNLRYAIGNVTTKPVTHFIYSHHHGDHTCAARQFTKYYHNVEFIGHARTLTALRSVSNDSCARPLPTRIFDQDLHLQIDNQTLELSWKGESHSSDTIFIWAPVQKTLMLVDIVFPRWAPFYSLGVASSVPGFIAAHDQALAYPFETLVAGHLGYLGTRQDVELQRDYITDLYNDCYAATVESADPANKQIGVANTLPPVEKAYPGNSWATFREWFDTVSDYCGSKVVDKYRGKLAAADVWLRENAETMFVSIRLDYGQLGPFGY